MPRTVVVELGEAVRALRARALLLRLLSPYPWFLGARLAVRPTGEVVLVAVTTAPSDVGQRAAVLARVATHLEGVQFETLVSQAPSASPTWRPRERPGQPAGLEGKL